MNTLSHVFLRPISQPSPVLYCNIGGSVSSFGPCAVASRHGEYRLSALGTTSWGSSPGPVASVFDLEELHFNAQGTIGPPGVVCRVKFAPNLLESQSAFGPTTLDINFDHMHDLLASDDLDGRAMLEEQHPMLKLKCLLLTLSISSAKLTTSSLASGREPSNLVSYFGSASASKPELRATYHSVTVLLTQRG